jgi:hypothetical protein
VLPLPDLLPLKGKALLRVDAVSGSCCRPGRELADKDTQVAHFVEQLARRRIGMDGSPRSGKPAGSQISDAVAACGKAAAPNLSK